MADEEGTGTGSAGAVDGAGCLRAGVEVCGVGAALGDDAADEEDDKEADDDEGEEGGTTLTAVEAAGGLTAFAGTTEGSGVGASAGTGAGAVFLPKMASSARAFLAAASGSLLAVTVDTRVRGAFFLPFAVVETAVLPGAGAGGGAASFAAEATVESRGVGRECVVGTAIATGDDMTSSVGASSSDAARSDPWADTVGAGEPKAPLCRRCSPRLAFLLGCVFDG